jgi:predicted NodU family carbamoyl transferase
LNPAAPRKITGATPDHEDATGRLHTVKQTQNALDYNLIKTLSQKSGAPVVLNTSFNENEPIADTPQQAVDCFRRTDMDALCPDPFITIKPGKTVEKLQTESRKCASKFGFPDFLLK